MGRKSQVDQNMENTSRNMQHSVPSPWNGSVLLDKKANKPNQPWLITPIGAVFASLIDGFICVLHRAEGMMMFLRRSWKDLSQMKVTGARVEKVV